MEMYYRQPAAWCALDCLLPRAIVWLCRNPALNITRGSCAQKLEPRSLVLIYYLGMPRKIIWTNQCPSCEMLLSYLCNIGSDLTASCRTCEMPQISGSRSNWHYWNHCNFRKGSSWTSLIQLWHDFNASVCKSLLNVTSKLYQSCTENRVTLESASVKGALNFTDLSLPVSLSERSVCL